MRPVYHRKPHPRSVGSGKVCANTLRLIWELNYRRAMDASTNWQQILFCCCTVRMEQATDEAKTAAIEGLVSSWSENIFVSFCLRAPRSGLTLWWDLGLPVEGTIQVPQLQLQLRGGSGIPREILNIKLTELSGTSVALWYQLQFIIDAALSHTQHIKPLAFHPTPNNLPYITIFNNDYEESSSKR